MLQRLFLPLLRRPFLLFVKTVSFYDTASTRAFDTGINMSNIPAPVYDDLYEKIWNAISKNVNAGRYNDAITDATRDLIEHFVVCKKSCCLPSGDPGHCEECYNFTKKHKSVLMCWECKPCKCKQMCDHTMKPSCAGDDDDRNENYEDGDICDECCMDFNMKCRCDSCK